MFFACQEEGKDVKEMYQIFNKKSGLLGISGVSNDTRDIEDAALKGNKRAILAQKMFARRVADFIGQYFVRLGGADMIVFSAGIGENAPIYRKLIVDQIKEALGVEIDEELNSKVRGKLAVLSTPKSKIRVSVIPTDEELMILRDTVRLLNLK